MASSAQPLGRLLVWSIMAILLAVIGIFLVFDYFYTSRALVRQEKARLVAEANTLLASIQRLRGRPMPELQGLLDETCATMHDTTSPGHHLVVRLGQQWLQAQSHHRASPQFTSLECLGQHSADGRLWLGGEALLVGQAEQQDLAVYVYERASLLQQVARRAIYWRLLSGLLAVFILGLLLNLLLHRLVVRPLWRMTRVIRKFANGNFQARMSSFESQELCLLGSEFDQMASALERARQERQAGLAKARAIQKNLLPGRQLQGLPHAVVFQPAEDVAGDYFDLLPGRNGAWLMCIADVTGHGVAAAMGSAMLKAILEEITRQQDDPGKVLERLNAGFERISLDEDFVTIFLARWLPSRGHLDWASAGHEPTYLLRREGTLENLSATGIAVGIMPEGEWPTFSVALSPGDRLLMLTDGIYETFSPQGEAFGCERLEELIRNGKGRPVEELGSQLLQALLEFRGERPQQDDLTFFAIEIPEP